MGRRERQPDTLDENAYVGEGAMDAFRNLSAAVVEGGKQMEQAYVEERAIAKRLLENLTEAVGGCLDVISSKFPKYAGEGRGVFLLERKDEKLFITATGSFLVATGTNGGRLMNPREVVEARWSIREIALALAEEMSANVDGQERKVRSVERMARKMMAVAELLDPEK